MSFIGDSVTEIPCHSPLFENLVAMLQFYRYKHLPEYNSKDMASADGPAETKRSYKATFFQRWRKLGDSTPSSAFKRFYAAQADVLLESDS